MKKILHVNIGNTFGGIEQLQLKYIKYLSNYYKIDVLLPDNKTNINSFYSLNIERTSIKNKIIYDYRLYKFLKKNKYDIVHINSEIFFFSLRVALISKLCGVRHIISHSHGYYNKKGIKGFLIAILNPLFRNLVDEYLACSLQAAESLFTKRVINKNKVKILKNGIEVEKYIFNENIREKYKNSLNLQEKIIYGHVGRFVYEKNHNFLIDLFYEIQKKQENAVLLLIGIGQLEEQIKNKVKELKIDHKVIFLGFRQDVYNILNTMDVFIFPSIYEGLGLSAIEAQTNGVITFCSNTVPKETNISPFFRSFDLKEKASKIAENICNENLNIDNRKEAYKYTIEKDYDIERTCNVLKNIYEKITENEEKDEIFKKCKG